MRRKELTHKEIREILKKNKEFIRTEFGVKKIALFGSFANGKQSRNSDIDFVVEFRKPDFDKFMGLVLYLEKVFGRKVDILTPVGIRSIRVSKVADEIRRGLVYV